MSNAEMTSPQRLEKMTKAELIEAFQSLQADAPQLRPSPDESRNSEERFQALFEQASDGITVTDPHGYRFLDANPAACRMFGYSREELLQMSAADVIAENEAPRLGTEFANLLGGEAAQSEWRVRRKVGSLFPCEVSARQLTDGRIQSFLRDVTERKQSELALRGSEARVGGIINSAMDAIISVNHRQQIVLFNTAAEKMFGYQAKEILGQPLARLIPERFRAAHEGHVRHFGATGETTRAMGALSPVSGLRRNGEEFPIEASISQIETDG